MLILEGVGRLTHRLIVVVALLIFFALALDTAGHKAVTTDEPLHLTHSIAMSQTGVMALPEMHTPLTYRLIAMLLGTEPPMFDITALDSWSSQNPYHISRELIWRDDIDTDRIVWLGRFVVAGMGVLLGALMAAWIVSLTRGHRPTLAAILLLYALSPNLLASASLVTTDIAATATWFLSVYTWWRYWQRPGWGRWLAAAIALGLALAAKLTGILLLPITFALALLYMMPASGRRRPLSWRPLLIWAGMLPVAGLVLWAFYGFEIRGWLPAPAYFEAWRLLLTEVDVSHASYFMGRLMPTGSWLYLPATLLLKTPPAQLVLFALIPPALWLERRRWRTLLFLLLPVVVFLAISAISRLNYGYRHILPAVPFLMVLGGLAIPRLWARRLPRIALVAALGWTAVAAVILHPDHLTYFNALARGQGYQYLGDSNLDWGQDLNQLADYAARYQAETGRSIYFTYTGMADREHYGLTGSSLIEQFSRGERDYAAANPAPGRYAINVADWQGVGLILGELQESDLFDWFRRREPMTTLGGSIFIYDVPERAAGTWAATCATRGRPLEQAQIDQLLGSEGVRHIEFDCQTSWVFPDGPGWYIVPLDGLPGGRLSAIGDQWQEVYRHHANIYGPDYLVAWWPGAPSNGAPNLGLQAYAERGDGPADLRGFGVDGAEWMTLWQVAAPTADPLSVKAHLLSGEGPPQVADGLGFTSDQWQAGDWFLQRHFFAAPGDSLETGLYNYVTLESAGPTYTLTATDK